MRVGVQYGEQYKSKVKSDGKTWFWIGVGLGTKVDWTRGLGMDMTVPSH